MTISANNHKDLLTTKEAASLLGFKKNTLEIWRTKGKGPQFIKVGSDTQSLWNGSFTVYYLKKD
ncbi:helix-turn-helix transcriptional regulator [Acinetobacter ursingii]|uniref:helix-turn-helix transcriptional regulator n=1 Tax=Acinetobacter ursingii TaxID=108980 RepID=UPI0021CD2E57|nr:helix-turn-helix domain-containing protein [Acinetobacter ursingii]